MLEAIFFFKKKKCQLGIQKEFYGSKTGFLDLFFILFFNPRIKLFFEEMFYWKNNDLLKFFFYYKNNFWGEKKPKRIESHESEWNIYFSEIFFVCEQNPF